MAGREGVVAIRTGARGAEGRAPGGHWPVAAIEGPAVKRSVLRVGLGAALVAIMAAGAAMAALGARAGDDGRGKAGGAGSLGRGPEWSEWSGLQR